MTGYQLFKFLEERGLRPKPSGRKAPNSWVAACPLCFRESAKDDADGDDTLSVWARAADGAGQMACWRTTCRSYDNPSLLWSWFDIEAPAEPVEGGGDLAVLLDDLVAFIRRFVVMSTDQAIACALWAAHTHAPEAAEATPYLAPNSAEKRSGKTRLFEVLELLVANPMRTANISVAALFRSIADRPPTLLFDELDAVFGGRRNGPPDNEDLRSLINAGHRRGATVYRMVGQGPAMEVRPFSVFCPKALAGIGELPDTVADRSIVLRLKRKAPGEVVERFRLRDVAPEGAALRGRLAAWAERHLDKLREARPELPDQLDDRAADGWEPLLAIGDAAGGTWPTRAREAAIALSAARGEAEADSLRVRLLADIRLIFTESDEDRMSSRALAQALADIEEAPWGDINKGKSLDARGLARRLDPFDIGPRTIRVPDGTTPKGYLREQFEDAWNRYLAPLDASQTPQRHNPYGERDSGDFSSATREGLWRTENGPDPASGNGCGGVAAECGPHGDGETDPAADGDEVAS